MTVLETATVAAPSAEDVATVAGPSDDEWAERLLAECRPSKKTATVGFVRAWLEPRGVNSLRSGKVQMAVQQFLSAPPLPLGKKKRLAGLGDSELAKAFIDAYNDSITDPTSEASADMAGVSGFLRRLGIASTERHKRVLMQVQNMMSRGSTK